LNHRDTEARRWEDGEGERERGGEGERRAVAPRVAMRSAERPATAMAKGWGAVLAWVGLAGIHVRVKRASWRRARAAKSLRERRSVHPVSRPRSSSDVT
jgi:hypothetical protein